MPGARASNRVAPKTRPLAGQSSESDAASAAAERQLVLQALPDKRDLWQPAARNASWRASASARPLTPPDAANPSHRTASLLDPRGDRTMSESCSITREPRSSRRCRTRRPVAATGCCRALATAHVARLRTRVAVPDFQTLMRPILVQLQDGQPRAIRDVRAALVSEFSLTDADLAEELPSGRGQPTSWPARRSGPARGGPRG
jgi:hypothetical protein